MILVRHGYDVGKENYLAIGDLFLKYFNEKGLTGADLAEDEDGDDVECDWCHMPLVFKDGKYYCVECDKEWSRQEFFDYIGADLPSDDCYWCDCKYPCVTCHLGHIEEDDEDEWDEDYEEDDE